MLRLYNENNKNMRWLKKLVDNKFYPASYWVDKG